jgi:catechol 2,3-dioxygenase-like lactoylglutathione lyase family enzyme
MKPKFMPGKNIAIKVPPHQYEQTVSFYRDVLGLEQINHASPDSDDSVALRFGDKNLWIDRVPTLSQAEIWLEVQTDNIEQAAAHFEKANIARRDEIETLPDGFSGFWISSPADIIHLVSSEK